ncbi:response regulator [Kordiimonas sp. SCSIO 12610]|uniref:response regulator n=1 Tax=Kordiimonas sp. SCSIO 12610 TaxID=2829597 RepID=UPI00210F0D0A|nr:response regulator [Kordiimonas sp. SCSIO 12610]UTW55147.1 response regulator [Kordiimonas sp. SCSIO 12610]
MAHILIAEDDPSVREFVSRVLTMHGHTVVEAEDGLMAIETLFDEGFDLVLSDIVMPAMDGISLALKIKADYPDLPIILMTGYADEHRRAHNLSALIDGLMLKPFNMEQLLTKITNALEQARARKEAYAAKKPAYSSASQSGT